MQRRLSYRVCAYSDVDSSMILITAYGSFGGPVELTSLNIVVIATESSGHVGADLRERHDRFCYILADFWEKMLTVMSRDIPCETQRWGVEQFRVLSIVTPWQSSCLRSNSEDEICRV